MEWPARRALALGGRFSSDDANKTVLFTMKAGTYTLEVAYREETSLLDALEIVKVN